MADKNETTNGKGTPETDKEKQKVKVRVRLRSPIEKIEEVQTEEKLAERKEKRAARRRRLADFGKGVSTATLVIGSGLVMYGNALKKRKKAKKKAEQAQADAYYDAAPQELPPGPMEEVEVGDF